MSEPIAVMRNRVSTEFKKVAPGSEEYLELQAQRDPNDGLPVWEETSLPNAAAQSKRLEEGNPLPHDIGDGAGPVGRFTGYTPDDLQPASAVRELLPSEREAGVELDDSPLSNLPQRDPVAEVEQVDTDVSGTEPELEDPGSSSSGASGKRTRKSKESSAKAAAEKSES